MAPMVWNTQNNEKLLIYVLATNPQALLDFEGAAKALTSRDHQCTARAVQERFKKMKRDVCKDPKWLVLAEQAGHRHGVTINKGVYGGKDDAAGETARTKTRKHARKSGTAEGPAPKKRKSGQGKAIAEGQAGDKGDTNAKEAVEE